MSYDGQRTEPTNFDRLAAKICWFGAAIIVGVHFGFVGLAKGRYARAPGVLSDFSELIYSPFFPISFALLMIFCAYYGMRMRRMYDNQTASNVLFVGIVTAVGGNFLQLYALLAPASRAIDSVGYY